MGGPSNRLPWRAGRAHASASSTNEWNMVLSCCVVGCSSRGGRDQVSFFSIPSVIDPGGCPEVEDLLANLGSARSTEKTGFHPSTVEFALLRLILPQQLAKSHSFSTRAGFTCPPGQRLLGPPTRLITSAHNLYRKFVLCFLSLSRSIEYLWLNLTIMC